MIDPRDPRYPAPPFSAASHASQRIHHAPPPFTEGLTGDHGFEQRGRRWHSVLNLLAVFIVGTAAGLCAAWWMGRAAPVSQVPQTQVAPADVDMQPTAAEPAASVKPPVTPLPSAELPFDGVAVDGEDVFVPRLPYRIEPMPGTSGSSETQGDEGVGEEVVSFRPDRARSAQMPTKKTVVEKKSITAEKDKAGDVANEVETSGGTRSPARTEVAESSAKAAAKATAKATEKVTSKATPKATPKATAKATKATSREFRRRTQGARTDDEIDRIRQQATDELWRKRVRERMPEQGHAGDGVWPSARLSKVGGDARNMHLPAGALRE